MCIVGLTLALSIDLNGNSSLEVNVLRALELGQERLLSDLAGPTLLMIMVFHDIFQSGVPTDG